MSKATLRWEEMDSMGPGGTGGTVNIPLLRARVPGGWLICYQGQAGNPLFIPDAQHLWGDPVLCDAMGVHAKAVKCCRCLTEPAQEDPATSTETANHEHRHHMLADMRILCDNMAGSWTASGILDLVTCPDCLEIANPPKTPQTSA